MTYKDIYKLKDRKGFGILKLGWFLNGRKRNPKS